MYCKYCGAVIDNDSRFCAQCGRQLSENDIVAEKAVWTDFNDYQQNTPSTQYEIEENSIEQEPPTKFPELLNFEISYSEDQNYFLPIDRIYIHYRVKNCNSVQLSINNNGDIQIRGLKFQNEERRFFALDLKEYSNLGEKLIFQLELGNDTWTVKSKELTAKIATNFKAKKYKKLRIIEGIIRSVRYIIYFAIPILSYIGYTEMPEEEQNFWTGLLIIAAIGLLAITLTLFLPVGFAKDYYDDLRKHN